MTKPQIDVRCDGEALVAVLNAPRPCASTAVLGGGIGWIRTWLDLAVPGDYTRTDPAAHLGEVADLRGLLAPVVGMLTAADVSDRTEGHGPGARAVATVGLGRPLAASAAEATTGPTVGTINLLVVTDAALSSTGLLDALQTATEAKVQALADRRVHSLDADTLATGTATDSLCVVGGLVGDTSATDFAGFATPSDFAGPATPGGAGLARAVHAAVVAGIDRWRAAGACPRWERPVDRHLR